jgi:GNAT superfamily N-acetyltransferase
MASMTIREIDLVRDAPAIVALILEVSPTALLDAPSYIHRVRGVPERADARIWVAEVDDRIVGRGECFRNFFTEGSRKAFANVAVREEYRRRGIGRALYELGLEHATSLDVDGLLTSFHENDAGVEFASGRGFSQVRAEAESVVDPRDVSEVASAEVELRPVGEVDPRLVYQIDIESTLDMPQTEQMDDIPYDEWEQHVLHYPMFTADGSFVAFADGVAAAVSLLIADLASGRASNMFTGTLRAYRGRGLALAVKLASIRWAAENGITMMATANDETNAPMLAINRRLGYRPAGRRVEWLKEGTASPPAPPAPAL